MLLDTFRFLPLFHDPFDSLTAPTFSIISNSRTSSMRYFYESNFRILSDFSLLSSFSFSSFLSMLKRFAVCMTYNSTKNQVRNKKKKKIKLWRYSIYSIFYLFYSIANNVHEGTEEISKVMADDSQLWSVKHFAVNIHRIYKLH